MLALARQAARSIGERMLDWATVADRALVEYFVRARPKGTRPDPWQSMNAKMIINAAARDHRTERSGISSGNGPSEALATG